MGRAIVTTFDPDNANWIDQDILKIVDATHVLYERTQGAGTYVVTDGKPAVTTSNRSFSHTRLFNGPKGEERWLTEKIVDGASSWVHDAAVVKVNAGSAFTTASAAHDWKSYINAGLAGASQFYIDLDANGTGLPNGQVRSWTLLATSDANIYVMERLQNLPGCDP